ncbi:hypothetical protein, partial [Nocardia puris]
MKRCLVTAMSCGVILFGAVGCGGESEDRGDQAPTTTVVTEAPTAESPAATESSEPSPASPSPEEPAPAPEQPAPAPAAEPAPAA